MLNGVIIKIMLLLLGSKSSLACWGSQEDREDYYEWHIEPTRPVPDASREVKLNVSHITDIIDRNKKIVWGGWTPPPEVEQDWRDWLVEYQLKANKSEGNKAKLDREREEEGNWPPGWTGLGEGFAGAPPPPWAFVPKYTGKVDACNHPPRYGSCKDKKTRWAWNAFLDKCMSYTWSGCGGSTNIFQNKLACEQACIEPAAPLCDSDSGIPIEANEEE